MINKAFKFSLFILIFTCHCSFAQEQTTAQEQATAPTETAQQESAQPAVIQEQSAQPAENTQPEEPAPAEVIQPQEPVIEPPEATWIEDSLPEGATTTGEWLWAQDIKFNGSASHTDGIASGLHSHSFKVAEPVILNKNSVIEQYVYLDPANPPKGIMLKLIASDGKETDLYWEGEEEVFVGTTEYMEAWYMNFLPEAGKWQKLTIKMEELEIAPFELSGISFVTYDGRSWWDSTVILD